MTMQMSMREYHLGHPSVVLVWRNGKKLRVNSQQSHRAGQNGAVQIEHLYEEECKTAQAESDLPWL